MLGYYLCGTKETPELTEWAFTSVTIGHEFSSWFVPQWGVEPLNYILNTPTCWTIVTFSLNYVLELYPFHLILTQLNCYIFKKFIHHALMGRWVYYRTFYYILYLIFIITSQTCVFGYIKT